MSDFAERYIEWQSAPDIERVEYAHHIGLTTNDRPCSCGCNGERICEAELERRAKEAGEAY